MLTSINMSFQDLNEFLFDADREQTQNKFIATSSNLYSLYDSNNYSYNNGTITYNSTTLQASSTSNRTLEMKNAYLSIPFGCTVSLGSDGSFTEDHPTFTANTTTFDAATKFNPRCANLITVKNFQHAILHSVRLVLGGKVLLTGSELHSLFTQEKMKRFNQDKQDLFGDLTCSHFDDDKAMRILPGGALEINNDPLNNEAIRKRSKLNTDYVSKTNFESLYPSNIPNDCFEGGLIAAYDDLGAKIMNPNAVTRRIKTLVFQYIAYIPLAFISPFFENMPSCRTLQSMELRITTNLSNNNSWKVSYASATVDNVVNRLGETNKTYKILNPTSTTSNQSVGSLCPFMISQLAEDEINDYGLPSISRLAAKPVVDLTVTPYIGFYASSDLGDNVVANGKITARPTNYPCAIHIPTVAYKANLLQEINNQPAQTILYDDFIVDTSIQQRAGGSTVMHNLTFTAGRLRKLYIIPYLHASANFCSVNQSLISSAPVTVSPCKLGNFMVSSASVNLFPQPLYHSHEFFTQMNMIGLAEANGNAFISPHVTGQINYDLFKRGAYNVYEVLLDRAYDEVADNQSPSLQVNFKILNNANCVYNFVLLTVFQSAAILDRIDGSIMSSSDV